MAVSYLAERVARRFLERKGYAAYPVSDLKEDDTPDLDSWRQRPDVPDGDHSELPGDENEEDSMLDGQTGMWTR
jgi:hypothetical protein